MDKSYFNFNTDGQYGAFVIPEDVHNKIGKILLKWLASEGHEGVDDMTLYVSGEAKKESQKNG
jgi:hypothetical protein|tara:strand:- start:830 stop:1018 length:189 start_codon:yes stop_codon:yes gene_type:complete